MQQKQYSIIDQASLHEDQQFNDMLKNSTNEIPLQELSGDEAIEKSFMTSSCESSVWAKRNSKTSVFLSSVTVMKSMVGVGILGIPNVMRNFGIILTITMMLSVYGLGLCASNLLLKSKNLSRRSNFSTIGFYIFKHKWIIIAVNITIIGSNIGTSLAELIIFGDTTQLIITEFNKGDLPFYFNRQLWICGIGIILFPLLIVKSIEKLRFVSLTAILSITTFTSLVIYNFFRVQGIPEGFTFLIPAKFNLKQAFASLPTLLLAYNWQFNLFPVYKSLQKTGDKRMMITIVLGYSMATMLYLTVGILGYATYGDQIQTNYLKSIDSKDVGTALYVVLNMTFVISSTLSIPILFFGGRNNFIQLIKSFSPRKKILVQSVQQYKDTLDGNDTKQITDKLTQIRLKKRSQKIRFYGYSTFLFIVIVVGAVFLQDLGLVFNIQGAVFCNAIQFVLPTLFYIFLVKRVRRGKFESQTKRIQYYSVWGLFVLSWILMVVCVVSELLHS